MKLITISGLDGSGKSTQIQLLRDHLESKGSKVFYFHAVEFSLARKITEFKNKYCLICRLTGRCKTENGKGVTAANAFQIWLRKIFLWIDICRFSALLKKLRRQNYDYVLSDRYFYDSFLNIEFLEISGAKYAEKQIPCPAPAPDAAFYLQVQPATIMQRERIPDQGPDYLAKKEALYEVAKNRWSMKTVSGERNKEEVFEEIKNLAIRE